MSRLNLLEAYKGRLEESGKVYKNTTGKEIDTTRKLTTAMLLNNTSKFMNEKFSQSVGTQRADLGLWKKFALNLTTVAVPNLIAPDLVITHPLSSMSGFITYLKFTAGSNKGDISQGHVFNDPFRLGHTDSHYTSSTVTEAVEVDSSDGVEYTLAWTPVIQDAFGEGKHVKFIPAAGGAAQYLPITDGKVTVPASGRVAYLYDNVRIPQNDLPILNAEIASLALVAKPRRIAIYFSQMAAYHAEQDYGVKLDAQLAEKAVGQLGYEIDVEIIKLLADNAEADSSLTFNKTLPYGVSKADHYDGFAEVLEAASTVLYNRTRRHAANYAVVARDLIQILTFLRGWKPAPAGKVNGPYFAGTVNAIKVFVSPELPSGEFFLGVNGDDMMTSAAVFAPYMAIVPTQLLGFADGAMSQGFSTLYALELLNKDLLVSGKVIAEPQVVLTDSGQ